MDRESYKNICKKGALGNYDKAEIRLHFNELNGFVIKSRLV